MAGTPLNSAPNTRYSGRPAMWALVALLIVAGVVGYRGYSDWQVASARLAAGELEDARLRSLEQPVTIQFGREVPLRTWVNEFRKQTGLSIEMEMEESLGGVDPFFEFDWGYVPPRKSQALRISLDLPTMPVYEALELLARWRQSQWQLRSDGVVVLGPEVEESLSLQVYPLPPELAARRPELFDILKAHIDPYEWEGDNPEVTAHMPDSLALLQPDVRHFRTRTFLQNLASAFARAKEHKHGLPHPDDPALEPIWLNGDAQLMALLQQALDRPISLDAHDMPWPQFVAELTKQAQFPILLHLDAQISGNVTCHLQAVPLRRVLERVPNDEPLAWIPLAGGRLLGISHPVRVSTTNPGTMFAYPVSDFTERDYPISNGVRLSMILASLVSEHDRDELARDGFDSTEDEKLHLIDLRLDQHERVRSLLAAMRRVRSGLCDHASAQPVVPTVESDGELDTRLNTRMPLEYRGERMEQIRQDLCFRGDISIPQPESVGGLRYHDFFIWCHLPNQPLREHLNTLVAEFGADPQALDYVSLSRTPQKVIKDDPRRVVSAVFDVRPLLKLSSQQTNITQMVEAVLGLEQRDPFEQRDIATFHDLLVVRCHPRRMPRVTDLLVTLKEYLASDSPRQWRGRRLEGDARNQALQLLAEDDSEVVRHKELSALHAALHAKLAQKVTVSIHDQRRGDAILSLAREYELPLVFSTSMFNVEFKTNITAEFLDQPLARVLQSLGENRENRRLRVERGFVTLSAHEEHGSGPTDFLFIVDDLIIPRGPLQPGQLVRTLLKPLEDSNPMPSISQWKLNRFQIYCGKLLWLYSNQGEPSRLNVQESLRKLRSGELRPLPAIETDREFSIPQQEPYGNSLIPVVGAVPNLRFTSQLSILILHHPLLAI